MDRVSTALTVKGGGLAGKWQQSEIGRPHCKTFHNFRTGADSTPDHGSWLEGAPDLALHPLESSDVFTNHFPAGKRPDSSSPAGKLDLERNCSFMASARGGRPSTNLKGGEAEG